ncbi:hypothetical protein M9Y10_042655 [Tritrichomonas musculus]|uniref:Uncharacterized protein n=1 Tax=Tritrichomonas musculus TaxID=1915356 RepID=A0ABR2JXT3_9EUKA
MELIIDQSMLAFAAFAVFFICAIMTLIKKNGNSSREEDQTDLIFKMKMQEKMLRKQSEKEDKNAKKERIIAKRYVAKGRKDLAQYHAQNSIRSSQISQSLLENSSFVGNMAKELQDEDSQMKTGKSLHLTTSQMDKYIKVSNPEKSNKMIKKYNKLKKDVQDIHSGFVYSPNCDDETMSLLKDLHQEIVEENKVTVTIPHTPIRGATMCSNDDVQQQY